MPTLLIIDDDKDLAQNLAAVLRHFRFEVLISTDAIEGLALARERKPSIVFTDYQMPNLNGIQLALAVRSTPGMSDTPIVIMTGAPDELSSASAEFLVLTKPLQLTTIFEAIGDKLSNHL